MKLVNSGALYAKDTAENTHFNIPAKSHTTVRELKEYLGFRLSKNAKQIVLRHNDMDLKVKLISYLA